MIRVLPFAIELILVIYCLIDLGRSDESQIRNLPRWVWVLAIIVVPIIGSLAWLLAGRPMNAVPRPRTSYEQPPRHRTIAPDDDPEFLRGLQRSNEHEDLLRQWEEDLRRREEELRKEHPEDPEG